MRKIVFILICICMLLSGCRNNAADVGIHYENVDNMISEAERFYEDGDISSSLTKYSEAMVKNPTDVNAMIGAAKCQIVLENYPMASKNLSAAVKVDPTDYRIYDLYVELSEKSKNLNFARTAVSLAQTYHVTNFLDKVPETPEISCPDGLYNSKFDVEISAPDESKIFVSETKGSSYISYEYYKPVTITRGDTNLEVYCVVDGIPSEIVTAKYVCDYPPVEVAFADPVIEQLVRLNLGNESGTITDVDCESITRIQQYDLRNNGMSWEEYEKIRMNSLEDMNLLPNLQQLYLEGLENITDFSALASCKNLSTLDFSDCNLQDISFVEYLPNLGYFNVSNNQITDLTPLLRCEHLYGLNVQGNQISDLSVLKDLDLEHISVSVTYLNALSVLNNWEDLTYLRLYGCGGCDLSCIGDLTNLTDLDLYAREYSQNGWDKNSVPIADISFIENLTRLDRLTLQGLSDYSQLEAVKPLSNLTYLYVQTMDYSSLPDNIRQELETVLPKCLIDD